MENLCKRICMPEEVTRAVLTLHRDPDFQAEIAGLCRESNWGKTLPALQASLGEDPLGYKMLCCMLRCALEAKADYDRLGLSDTVYVDTMSAFSRFVREHKESFGGYGFDRGFWTVRQVSCKLFRIGEMEYELTQLDGRKAISLHIPSDARLDRFCESWDLARPLLEKTFPEYENAPVFCRSWLLASELTALIPPESRILRFREKFAIRPLKDSTGGYVRWIYKDPRLAQEEYPENTTLQRNLKAWLLQGGTLTDGLGILLPKEKKTLKKP